MATQNVRNVALACAIPLLAGCSLRTVNRATLAASTAALACDWSQTRAHAAAGWPDTHETNPIMGERPHPLSVDAYFATSVALNVAVWLAMPERWRSAAPTALLAVQGDAIAESATKHHGTVCGL
jgi:hypothetical protein